MQTQEFRSAPLISAMSEFSSTRVLWKDEFIQWLVAHPNKIVSWPNQPAFGTIADGRQHSWHNVLRNYIGDRFGGGSAKAVSVRRAEWCVSEGQTYPFPPWARMLNDTLLNEFRTGERISASQVLAALKA